MKIVLLTLFLILAIVNVISAQGVTLPAGWEFNAREYKYSSTITLAVSNAGEFNTGGNLYIGAFADDECRGVARAEFSTVVNGKAIYFLMVYMNESNPIEMDYRILFENNEEFLEFYTGLTEIFEQNSKLNSPSNPKVLNIGAAVSGTLKDNQGNLVDGSISFNNADGSSLEVPVKNEGSYSIMLKVPWSGIISAVVSEHAVRYGDPEIPDHSNPNNMQPEMNVVNLLADEVVNFIAFPNEIDIRGDLRGLSDGETATVRLYTHDSEGNIIAEATPIQTNNSYLFTVSSGWRGKLEVVKEGWFIENDIEGNGREYVVYDSEIFITQEVNFNLSEENLFIYGNVINNTGAGVYGSTVSIIHQNGLVKTFTPVIKSSDQPGNYEGGCFLFNVHNGWNGEIKVDDTGYAPTEYLITELEPISELYNEYTFGIASIDITVKGTILDRGGDPLSENDGVTLTAGNGIVASIQEWGEYIINLPTAFKGTITPSIVSLEQFNPEGIWYEKGLFVNESNRDFICLKNEPKLWGIVTDRSGNAIQGVEIVCYDENGNEVTRYDEFGNIIPNVQTESDGLYNIAVPLNFNGSIQPRMDGWYFTPTNSNNVLYDIQRFIKEVNFEGYAMTKFVEGYTLSNYNLSPMTGISIEFQGDNGENYNTISDNNGYFKQYVPDDWTGKVSPQRADYFFVPKNYYFDGSISNILLEFQGGEMPDNAWQIWEFKINNGEEFTGERNITLDFYCPIDPDSIRFTENVDSLENPNWGWQPYEEQFNYRLSAEPGPATFYAQVKLDTLISTPISTAYIIRVLPNIMSISINNGEDETTSRNVSLSFEANWNTTHCDVMIDTTNYINSFGWTAYEDGMIVPIELLEGRGMHSVWVVARNYYGFSEPSEATIFLESDVIAIYGKVIDEYENGIDSVSIIFTDNSGWSECISDSEGNYRKLVPRGWSGTIDTYKDSYFSDDIINTVDSSNTDENYYRWLHMAQVRHEVSGKVISVLGNTVADISINTDIPGYSVQSDTNGDYILNLPQDYSGSIQPQKDNWTFEPSGFYINNLLEPIDSIDFVGEGNLRLLTVDEHFHYVGREASNISINVTNDGNAHMTYNAVLTEGSDWVRIDSGAIGMDSGEVYISYDAWSGSEREAEITITGENTANGPQIVKQKQVFGYELSQVLKPVSQYNHLLSMDVDGDNAIAAVEFSTDHSRNVYMYEKIDNLWYYYSTLPYDNYLGNRFGESVAIWGSYAVVGDINYQIDGTTVGAAYVFERHNENWQKVATLTPTIDEETGYIYLFGTSIDFDENRIIVAAHTANNIFFIFEKPKTGWGDMQETDRIKFTNLSSSIAYPEISLSGKMVAISHGLSDGRITIFDYGNGSWSEQTTIQPLTSDSAVYFGKSLQLNGNQLITSAEGRVYIYSYNGLEWSEEFRKKYETNARASRPAVAIDNDMAAVIDYRTNEQNQIITFTEVLKKETISGASNVNWFSYSTVYLEEQSVIYWYPFANIRGGKVLQGCSASAGNSYYLLDITGTQILAKEIFCEISGSIKSSDNTPLESCKLITSDGEILYTDISGQFSVEKPFSWSGAILPENNSYIFNPENLQYTNLIENQISQDIICILDSSNVMVENKLKAFDGTTEQYFGVSVAINGDYAAVGAHLDDEKVYNAGAVYIYKKTGYEWNFIQKVFASDFSYNMQFGYNISMSDSVLVIGNPYTYGVYVFELLNGMWSQTAKIHYSPYQQNYARRIANSNQFIVLSDYNNSGYVGVYRKTNYGWEWNWKFTSSSPSSNSNFGGSIDIDENRIIIGAEGDNSSKGAAYIYEYQDNDWILTKRIELDSGSISFGERVAISGDYVLIKGQPTTDYINSVYFYKLENNDWIQYDRKHEVNYPGFGATIDIDGNYAIINTALNPNYEQISRLYKFDGSNWMFEKDIISSDLMEGDGFGTSANLSGIDLIIGAMGDDDNGDYSGSAYIYCNIDGTSSIGKKNYQSAGSEVPVSYKLCQNYPNPFNPTTTIKFDIPEKSNVELSIYNILGQRVEVLVQEELDAGYHKVEFDASRFASGVYIYMIRANDFRDVKKMVLLK